VHPANWNRDPFGLALFAATRTPSSMTTAIPGTAEYPASEPSDQKYARWYPSAIALPNDTVLVVGGFDQDNSVGPDPPASRRAARTGARRTRRSPPAVSTRWSRGLRPEDRSNIALENARMAFPLYPQLEVVETGPGKDDWKVCTFDGEMDYGNEAIPGGAKFGIGGGTPDFKKGTTWCLDVLAALKDPNRDIPAKNHWDRSSTPLRRSGPTAAPLRALWRLTVTGTRCRTSCS